MDIDTDTYVCVYITLLYLPGTSNAGDINKL